MQVNVAFLTADISRLMRKRFDMMSRGFGATGPQWRALGAINRTPGITQAALAAWLEVEAITAGRMVDRLEKAKLVERRADPADRRAWRLYLTPMAAPLMEQLQTCADTLIAETLGGISDAEHAHLLQLLRRIRCNLLEDPVAIGPLPGQAGETARAPTSVSGMAEGS